MIEELKYSYFKIPIERSSGVICRHLILLFSKNDKFNLLLGMSKGDKDGEQFAYCTSAK